MTRGAVVNPLNSKGNYSAISNNTKLVHWPLTGGLLHLVQRGGLWAGCGPAQYPPRCTKCNSPPTNGQCTNHCIAMWIGPLLCGFNAANKGLRFLFLSRSHRQQSTVGHGSGPCTGRVGSSQVTLDEHIFVYYTPWATKTCHIAMLADFKNFFHCRTQQ